jgi:hypothetical protein
MARISRPRRRERHTHPLLVLAIHLLATAEEPDDYITVIAVARIAYARIRQEGSEQQKTGRYGPRGPYNRVKSTDFFDLLLYQFTERQFKNWLR